MSKKKVQYYKVIDKKRGHHGFFYKMGINEDPYPLDLNHITSCGRGALYFTTGENLADFADYGEHIAWVTPISPIKNDVCKFKAHKIKITKILPFKKALPLIKEISPIYYGQFGIKASIDEISSYYCKIEDKLIYIKDNYGEDGLLKFIKKNPKNKKAIIRHFKEWGGNFYNFATLKFFIENDFWELVNENEVARLAMEGKMSLIKKLLQINHDKYLKILMKFSRKFLL